MTARPTRSPAVPARFNAADQHRRAMMAKVHVAKKALALADDDYRAVLFRVVGRSSAGDCSQKELEAVVAEFTRLGFTATARPKSHTSAARPADHPLARKARAMWISLNLLGAVNDPSEKALEAFARRQLGCQRLQWANQSQGTRLIEALKAIAEREGWNQSTEGLPRNAVALNLKRRLVEALLAKLRAAGIVPEEWNVDRAAFELAGIEIELIFASVETLDLAARTFGRVLAEHGR